MKTKIVFVAAALAAGWCAGADDCALRRKYIGHGWDLLAVTPEEVLAHADEFDRTGLDGVALMPRVTTSDGRVGPRLVPMDGKVRTRDELKGVIPVFREIVRHRGLRESFLFAMWAPPKRLAWTDDAAWASFAANMGTMAWLAKEGGLRGLLVDPEDYPRARQYRRLTSDPPYDETARLARARGAQVGAAMFREFPDMALLSFWWLSVRPNYFVSDTPCADVRAQGDLWPAFINGLLDALPPEARFVDGNEHAYRYEAERGEFFKSATFQRARALSLIAPENRAKYRAQVRAGFGLYLDCYINPTNSPWYFGPVDGSRTRHFELNLEQATQAADEYIWIYGEKRGWVSWSKADARRVARFTKEGTWDACIPGLYGVMGRLKDPVGWLTENMDRLLASSDRVNRAAEKYGTWQDDRMNKGKFAVDRTCGDGDSESLRIDGTGNGCYTFQVDGVTTGEVYAVEVSVRGENISVSASWQLNGRWQWGIPSVNVPIPEGASNVWRRARGLVRVPAGADRFVVLLSARLEPGTSAWFDNLRVYRLGSLKSDVTKQQP